MYMFGSCQRCNITKWGRLSTGQQRYRTGTTCRHTRARRRLCGRRALKDKYVIARQSEDYVIVREGEWTMGGITEPTTQFLIF